jgi:hypothetical protein
VVRRSGTHGAGHSVRARTLNSEVPKMFEPRQVLPELTCGRIDGCLTADVLASQTPISGGVAAGVGRQLRTSSLKRQGLTGDSQHL